MLNHILTFVKQERRTWVLICVFITVLAVVYEDTVKSWIENYDPVVSQAEVSEKINTELAKILEYSDADRVYIFQFHNGVTYYNGQHAQRFTCTYEITRDGISREADNLKDLQVSVYSWFINETIRGNMGYTDTDSIPNYTTRYSLHAQGIKSIRVLPIVKDHHIVGLIGIDYVRMKNPFLMDSISREWFEAEAKKVSELIH